MDQHPIHSGWNEHSTASDVLAGQRLDDIVAMVTGGYSGLGLETTKTLAHAGAKVVVLARRKSAAEEALRDVPDVEILEGDLSNLASLRSAANSFLATGRHLDILINNAGIMACPETRLGATLEAQFAVNHLGHFALTAQLWPALKGGARVVAVSSAGHHLSDIRWDDMQMRNGYDKWLAYGQSKTANILFALHLDRLGKEYGVRAFSLHPGKIFTPLQRHLEIAEMVAAGWLDINGNPADPTFKTAQQGAATQVWASTSTQVQAIGGVYCEDCNVVEVSVDASFVGVREYAINPESASRLWDISENMTGLSL